MVIIVGIERKCRQSEFTTFGLVSKGTRPTNYGLYSLSSSWVWLAFPPSSGADADAVSTSIDKSTISGSAVPFAGSDDTSGSTGD